MSAPPPSGPIPRLAAGLALLYVLVAIAIALGFPIDGDDVRGRVGPGNDPGPLGRPSAERRLERCRFLFVRADRCLRQSRPRAALEEEFAHYPGRPAACSEDELRERCRRARELYNSFVAIDDVDQHPELEPRIAELEAVVASLFEPRPGLHGAWRSTATWLGTDASGRSILWRSLSSISVALRIGLLTAVLSVLLGSLLGAAAGTFGGWVDAVVRSLFTVLSSVPQLVLLIVLLYALRDREAEGSTAPMIAVFCGTFWIGPCRVVRGEALRLREMEFVQAAVGLGFSRTRVLLRHVLPSAARLSWVQGALLFVGAVKSEVVLSFLGLSGHGEPSFGLMIRDAAEQIPAGFYWELGSATVILMGLILCVHALGDHLQRRTQRGEAR